MKMMRMIGAALAAVLLATAAQAQWHVDVNYDAFNGAPDGTTSRPFTTITDGIAAANAGGSTTVLIAGGTYVSDQNGGNEDFGTAGITLTRSLTVRGGYVGQVAPGAAGMDWGESSRVLRSTIINLQNAGTRAFLADTSNLSYVFDGMTFQHSNHTLSGGAIRAGGAFQTTVTIRNCLFTNNVTSHSDGGGAVDARGNYRNVLIEDCDFVDNRAGVYGGAVRTVAGTSSYVTIRRCTFVGNAVTGTSGNDFGGALHVAGGHTIEACTFTGNASASHSGALGVGSGSFTVRRSTFANNSASSGASISGVSHGFTDKTMTFENCLFVGNTGTYTIQRQGAGNLRMRHCTLVDNINTTSTVRNEANNMLVKNSILMDNGPRGLQSTGGTTDVDYNNVLGHTTANYDGLTAGVNAISVDPQFVNAGTGDYRLAQGSPCIDAGTDLGITVDIDGFGRPSRAGFDMGAYEEWQLPAIAYRYPMAQSTEVTPRVILSHQPDGHPTDAWIVLDTEDKGTGSVGAWGQSIKIDTPVAGVIFGHTFTGLTADTDYVYRVWVSNAYDNAWGELGDVRTLANGAPLQLLWTPTSANQRWSTTASETNWTANAGMTLTTWVHGASAVFEGLPTATPNAWGGGMQFNSIKLIGVASGTLTIGKVSGDDVDHLVAVGDAVIDLPAGTTITLPQVRGTLGLEKRGGSAMTTTRSYGYSGTTRLMNGTIRGSSAGTLPPGRVEMLDDSGSANVLLHVSGWNNTDWVFSRDIVVRGGSTGTATVQNSTSTGSNINPSLSGNLSLTNTLNVLADSRTLTFTLSGSIEGPGQLRLHYNANNNRFRLSGDGAMHGGPLDLVNTVTTRTGLAAELNGTRGNANITAGVNIAISGTATLMCNIEDGVADKITLGNNASIDLSGLTLEPIDPVRTPAEYPLISPKSRVTGEFAAVIGKFEIAYDGTDTYPNDVVLIVPAPPGTLFLMR